MEEEDDHTKLLENALGAVRKLHAAAVPDTKSTRELMIKFNTLKRRFDICCYTLQNVEDHRTELKAQVEELEATNQELGKKVKTLDAMRDLLEPVRGA